MTASRASVITQKFDLPLSQYTYFLTAVSPKPAAKDETMTLKQWADHVAEQVASVRGVDLAPVNYIPKDMETLSILEWKKSDGAR